MKKILFLYLTVISWTWAATPVVTNEHVAAYDETLQPAETESSSEGLPNVTVFLSGGIIRNRDGRGQAETKTVKRGDVIFREGDAGPISDAGPTEVRMVRVELRGKGSEETWGRSGFAPTSRLLFENALVRAYDIRVPAGVTEARHSHHDRVVVCLSGAKLKHTLDDGRQQVATLKTGEIAWRLAQTHVGQNLGATDLWVIAIEPK